MKIAIVGPCAAGKTMLAKRLCALGYDAHDVAQEHSLVPSMWAQITKPDLLIYLDVSLTAMRKRLQVEWEERYFDELCRRVADARTHADFVLPTDELAEEQVVEQVVRFIRGRQGA